MPGPGVFGAALRRARRAAGLSQEALAERAGLSVDAIAALERGRRTAPRPDTLARLAAALPDAERTALLTATEDHSPPRAPIPPTFPVPPTQLIGREEELADLRAHIVDAEARLVTLTGPGGVGKTRLALAVAAALAPAFPEGVAFTDLAPLRDPATLAPALARALGRGEGGARDARDWLLAHLRDRRILLLLDNCEQIADTVANLAADLLAASPRLVVLATSRIALRLAAEQQFPVPPLALPDQGNAFPPDPGAAVELFAARARAVSPDFRLDPGNTRTAAAICARLDGLPLAIELAAAHSSALPPGVILTRLEHRLDSLASGMRDLPDRQRTLRATIGWSYDLLGESERALFRSLAVFAGGCTLEAAEAICDPDGARDILATVAALAEQSLLRRVEAADPWRPGDGEPRLMMLEMLREYAAEQLEASGEGEELRRRHAAYYLTLAECAAPELRGTAQAAWLTRLEVEHDNLRAALAWARSRTDVRWSLRLASALWPFWYIRCHLSEGRGWLEDCLALPSDAQDEAQVRAAALVGLANLAYLQADYDSAATAAIEATAIGRDLGSGSELTMALNILGAVARNRSDFGQAAVWFEEELALARAAGDRWHQATALQMLAEMARYQGDYERAVSHARESAALFKALGDRSGIAQSLAIQGNSARDQGDLDEAAALLEESLLITRDLGHTRDFAQALTGLGDIARMWGDSDGAATLIEQSLALLEPLGDRRRHAASLTALGHVHHAQGNDATAVGLYQDSLATCREIGDRLGIVVNLEGLACVANWSKRAVRLLATAATLRTTIGAPLPPMVQSSHDALVAGLRAALGETGFAESWAAGETLPLDAIIAEALAWDAGSAPPAVSLAH